MKKYSYYLLIAMFVALNLFQISRYQRIKSSLRITQNQPPTHNNIKQLIIDESVPFKMKKLEVEKGDSIAIEDFFSSSRLVLRVSEFNCGSCVDSTLLILHKYASQLKDHVVILANITNERNRIVFKRVHGLNEYPFYYLNEHRMPLKAEKSPIDRI